jgi:hypothetical protein
MENKYWGSKMILNKLGCSVAVIMMLLTLFLILFFVVGCQIAPDRKNYESELAFMLADCNYRNQKSPLACVELAKRYNDRDMNKEQREILTFCKDCKNYPEGWDNEKCRMFLRQR